MRHEASPATNDFFLTIPVLCAVAGAIACKAVNATPVPLKDVSEHPFLCGLTHEHLQILADYVMRVHFEAGDIIFHKGDPANRFYLVMAGRVAVEDESRDREHQVVVQTIGPGDVLGWSWLFPPYYFEFAARALEPTEMMFFYGTRLRDLCEDNRDLGYELLKRVAKVVIQRLSSVEKQFLRG